MIAPLANLGLIHRLTAGLCIAVVLALNVLAVWPSAHALIHGISSDREHSCARDHTHDREGKSGDPVSSGDNCVIVKFAGGHASLDLPLDFGTARFLYFSTFPAAPQRNLPVACRFVLPPGCGPPAA